MNGYVWKGRKLLAIIHPFYVTTGGGRQARPNRAVRNYYVKKSHVLINELIKRTALVGQRRPSLSSLSFTTSRPLGKVKQLSCWGRDAGGGPLFREQKGDLIRRLWFTTLKRGSTSCGRRDHTSFKSEWTTHSPKEFKVLKRFKKDFVKNVKVSKVS